jgi:tetratricopeptide (TPR) repeat protein
MGDDHPGRVASLNNLAAVLIRKREYAAAEDILRTTRALWESTVGRDTTLARALCNLAYVRNARGAPKEAEALYEEALAIRDAVVPDPSMDTAAPLSDLARIKRALGDRAGEIAALQRSVGIAVGLLGPADQSVVRTHIELAQSFADSERHAECLATLDTISEHLASAFGEADPAVADAGRLRARALQGLGRREEAAAVAAAHLAWCRQHVGEDDARTRQAAELVLELTGGK